jgi:N-acyl homoserine lactone hydrolase
MKQFAMAACFAIGVTCLISQAATLQNKPKPPKSARVYVFDCGLLTLNSPANFGFTKEEVGEKVVLAVPCYLIVHPKGTLMWDTGVIPDAQVDGAIADG